MTATSVPLTPISATPAPAQAGMAALPPGPGDDFSQYLDQATPQTPVSTGEVLQSQPGKPLPLLEQAGELAPLLPQDWGAYPVSRGAGGAANDLPTVDSGQLTAPLLPPDVPVSEEAGPAGAEALWTLLLDRPEPASAQAPAPDSTPDPDSAMPLAAALAPAPPEIDPLPLTWGAQQPVAQQGGIETSTPPIAPAPQTQSESPVALIASVPGRPVVAELVAEARPEGFDPASGRAPLRPFQDAGPQAAVLEPGGAGAGSWMEGQGADDGLWQGLAEAREPLVARQPSIAKSDGEGAFLELLHHSRQTTPSSLTNSPATELRQLGLELPLGSRGWSQGLGERLQWLIGRDIQQAEVRLNPQHLGPLEIRVSMQNDQANVTILAQHALTREAVEASLPRLREMLQEANLSLGSLDVGQRELASQGGGQGARPGQAGRGFASEMADENPLEAAQPRLRLQGLVDAFA